MPLRKPIFPDVDMHGLLDREAKTWSSMIEDRRFDPEARLLMEHAIPDATVADLFSCEGVLEPEPGSFGRQRGSDLGDREHEVAGIPVRQIPEIRMSSVLHVLDKPLRPKEAYAFFSSDQQSQQPIEADEVIDMGMRDKDMFDPLYLARRQRRDVAQVKQDRMALEQRLDIERRVSGSPIDQSGMQKRPHAGSNALRRAASARQRLRF